MLAGRSRKLHGMSLLLAITVACLSGSCARSQPSLPAEVHTALQSLQRLQAATEVGVAFNTYEKMVIEAKAHVNTASLFLPARQQSPSNSPTFEELRAELGEQLRKAVDAYADALAVWTVKMRGGELSPDLEPGNRLIPKYQLHSTNPDSALQTIWHDANLRTSGVTGLVNTIENR